MIDENWGGMISLVMKETDVFFFSYEIQEPRAGEDFQLKDGLSKIFAQINFNSLLLSK